MNEIHSQKEHLKVNIKGTHIRSELIYDFSSLITLSTTRMTLSQIEAKPFYYVKAAAEIHQTF